ncbi:MAG: UDP-N-acetylmuramate--L-alanine ligase [Alphaproteobacteria bacterium]|nr:UDP-N-acetylmuramate--L-alanine ligase [Alphaproteobacteria bacterium]
MTKLLPFDMGPIHFIGIGGIGMSGIAEVMHNLGYRIQGSDAADNYNVKRLQKLGITVQIGQQASNLGEARIVVISSAIKADNPELAAARARQLPIVRRAEMLAELMRLKWCVAIGGTHGKTTTTTMVATLLDAGRLDPTVINGGIINAYGTNARRGEGDWMVVEADESDGTLVKLPATIAVVTNIDPEHLDHYGTFEKVKDAFLTFVENVPFYGLGVICIDHPEVQALIGRVNDRRIVTYGFSAQADVRAVNVDLAAGASRYDVVFSDRVKGGAGTVAGFEMPMPGQHNVQNSLAAIAVGRELGLGDAVMQRALAAFGGVKRRFTRTGEWRGVTIIDDYGHHPVEIAAVMKAARQVTTRHVIAVLQPHRYSRLKDLFAEFCTCVNDADTVIVADVYAAGEAPIEGINRDALIDGLRAHGHRDVRPLGRPEELPQVIAGLAEPGDYIVCLGAGSISTWANALPAQLAALEPGGGT